MCSVVGPNPVIHTPLSTNPDPFDNATRQSPLTLTDAISVLPSALKSPSWIRWSIPKLVIHVVLPKKVTPLDNATLIIPVDEKCVATSASPSPLKSPDNCGKITCAEFIRSTSPEFANAV